MPTRLTSTVLFALGLAMATVNAQAFERCEPFTVFTDHDAHEITLIDLGEVGPSIGDRPDFSCAFAQCGR